MIPFDGLTCSNCSARWLDGGVVEGPAQARSLCERLSRAPVDQAAAAAMSELLPGAVASPGWAVLPAEVMTSAGGADPYPATRRLHPGRP